MVRDYHESSPAPRSAIAAVMALLGLLALAATLFLTDLWGVERGEMLTRNTVRLALVWYVAALCLMMQLRPRDWRAATRLGLITRWCWSWAILCFLVHLGMAFHFYDHWSHAQAFERTRQVSGIGQGLYVSYFFTLVWAADVASWWLAPAWYQARPAWIDRAMHGFMLFIVFNSTVVYEAGTIRWAGLAAFTGLAIVWLRRRQHRLLAKTALGTLV